MPPRDGARALPRFVVSLLAALPLVGLAVLMTADRAEAQRPRNPPKTPTKKPVKPIMPKPGAPNCSGFIIDPNGNCSEPAPCLRPPNNICASLITPNPTPRLVAGAAGDNCVELDAVVPCGNRQVCKIDTDTGLCGPSGVPFGLTTKEVADAGACPTKPVQPAPPTPPTPTPTPEPPSPF